MRLFSTGSDGKPVLQGWRFWLLCGLGGVLAVLWGDHRNEILTFWSHLWSR